MAKIEKIKSKDIKKAFNFTMCIFEEMGWDKRFNYGLENLVQFFGGDREIFLLVKDNDKIIGCGGLKQLSKRKAVLKRFYVAKDFRGKGISQKLFERIKKFAEKQGYKNIVLDTFKDNFRAKNFYKKMGFKPYNPKPHKKWKESEDAETFDYRILKLK